MNREKDFLDGKKSALENLTKATDLKQVDSGIIPILNIINNSDEFYTTSSCFGRTVLLEIPTIGNKKEAKFLGKWHRSIELKDLLKAIEDAKEGQIWILSQSPIIHIAAFSDNAAEKILKVAIACGFKNSGLKSIGKRIVIEILSTERLDAPIGKDGKVFCNNEYLDLLVKISNEIIEKSTLKLKKFEEKLRKDLRI